MKKCLICHQSLETGDYHDSCSKKFFGTTIAPILQFSLEDIGIIAAESVLKSITLTGVQSKLSLRLSRKSGGEKQKFTIVGLWGSYILKPPTSDYPFLPENEDVTMHLADFFGIKTVPHALIRFVGGEIAYITRRIDRVKKTKKHMEDMCQLQNRLAEDKYKGSLEQISKIITRYSSNPGYDIQRFFESVLFSYLTGNADMHMKNYSLFYQNKDIIEFAPAYDLLNTALVIPGDREETALTIGGKRSKLKKEDFDNFSDTIGILPIVRERIYNKFRKNTKSYTTIIENSFLPEEMKSAYTDIMRSRIEKLHFNE